MKKYVCTACGYIYDEAQEGVKWEDLGEDWVCPVCGVGKEFFQLVEEQNSYNSQLLMFNI